MVVVRTCACEGTSPPNWADVYRGRRGCETESWRGACIATKLKKRHSDHQCVNRKFQARHTFLTQATDAMDLGRSPPHLTSEMHALPLVAIASSENFGISFTPHPEWARVVKEASVID